MIVGRQIRVLLSIEEEQPVRGRGSSAYSRAVRSSGCEVAGGVTGGSALGRQGPAAPLHLFVVVNHGGAFRGGAILVVRASVTGRALPFIGVRSLA